MAGRLEHADERGRIAAIEVTVAGDRVIAHFFDVIVGVKQSQQFAAGRYRRLQRQVAVQTKVQQLGLERVMTLRAEGVAVFEAVIGELLAEINADIFGRHENLPVGQWTD